MSAAALGPPQWLHDFFVPLYTVASWFVGIFGGLIVGLVILLLGVVLAALCVFAVVVAVIKIGDAISEWKFQRARRRLQRRCDDLLKKKDS